jgi:hypothetical protein
LISDFGLEEEERPVCQVKDRQSGFINLSRHSRVAVASESQEKCPSAEWLKGIGLELRVT